MSNENNRRKVVTRSPGRKVGLVNSCKWLQNEPIEHESNLEKHFISRALLCARRIQSQPCRLSLPSGRTFFPDFALDLRNAADVVVEVKFSGRVKHYVEVFNDAARKLGERGLLFYVATEREICFANRHGVARQVLRYAKSELNQNALMRARLALAEVPEMTCAEIERLTGVSREAVLHLIATQVAEPIDEGLICATTRIRLTGGEDPVQSFERRMNLKPWNVNTPVEPIPPKPSRPRLKKLADPIGPFVRSGAAEATPAARLAGGLPAQLPGPLELPTQKTTQSAGGNHG